MRLLLKSLLTLFIFAVTDNLRADDSLTFAKLFDKLVSVHHAGWEISDPKDGNNIVTLKDFPNNLTTFDRELQASTDYKSISDREYLIMIPKKDGYGLLTVTIPDVKNEDSEKVLNEITCASHPDIGFMGAMWVGRPGYMHGSVSLKGGTYTYWALVTEIARQIKANGWIISPQTVTIKKTLKLVYVELF